MLPPIVDFCYMHQYKLTQNAEAFLKSLFKLIANPTTHGGPCEKSFCNAGGWGWMCGPLLCFWDCLRNSVSYL